jgi:hypothetical protein
MQHGKIKTGIAASKNPLATLRHFAAERRAVTAVEFSINVLALMLFFFAIINLGDLGLVVGTMKHAVQSSVRNAAVTTGANIAASGNLGACATESQILASFNGIASPILPAAGDATNNGAPIVQSSWVNNAQGATLTVSATYQWVPVGMPNNFTPALSLDISSTQTVIGTSGANTTCE